MCLKCAGGCKWQNNTKRENYRWYRWGYNVIKNIKSPAYQTIPGKKAFGMRFPFFACTSVVLQRKEVKHTFAFNFVALQSLA